MVKAELRYNPYALKTKVSFNGREPRINSLVEKYIGGSLEDWIDKVPGIFAGEMNGYGFELDFFGTAFDFEALRRAFRRAGVGDGEVVLFLKNELEPREKKLDEIDQLLAWLESRRNRQLDLPAFRERHPEIFDKSLNLVLIGGTFLEGETLHGMKVAVDNIEDAAELNETRLQGTPVVFWIDGASRGTFQRNLSQMLARDDVTPGQLFFAFGDGVDGDKACRVIEDLGVKHPQVVASVGDEKIKNYMTVYPVTAYIHRTLCTFKAFAQKAKEKLGREQQKSQGSNRALRRRIDGVIGELAVFKQSLEAIENRDNLALPEAWQADARQLMEQIGGWQRRKTKISGETDGRKMAADLNAWVQHQYRRFMERFSEDVRASLHGIEKRLAGWYEPAAKISAFKPQDIVWDNPKVPDIPAFQGDLLALREERTVMEKGFFDTAAHPVHHVDFQVQKWRAYAADQVRPAVEGLLKETFAKMQAYDKALSRAYSEHLRRCIREKDQESSALSAQLSDEERRLQEDADWIGGLSDQLEQIERD